MKKRNKRGKEAGAAIIFHGRRVSTRRLQMPQKKYASRYYQLKVGHGAVGTYLAKIGAIDTPQCWWCDRAEQTVEHLYTECRRWRKERQMLMRTLCKEGIRCQGWTERKRLAELLANKKAIGPILGFLKSTEVGKRVGARERENEW